MTYIVENNGVYGLTKGQFSATADRGSKSKRGAINRDAPIDMVSLALQLGVTYVARGFSGDKDQLVPLIKGALKHRGAALLDVISPCVAFNNHAGSTKSYDYVRNHNDAVNRLDFMPRREEIVASYEPGEVIEITQHDGSRLRLRKLADGFDPGDRARGDQPYPSPPGAGRDRHRPAVRRSVGRRPARAPEHRATPLNRLTESDLCPGAAALEADQRRTDLSAARPERQPVSNPRARRSAIGRRPVTACVPLPQINATGHSRPMLLPT